MSIRSFFLVALLLSLVGVAARPETVAPKKKSTSSTSSKSSATKKKTGAAKSSGAKPKKKSTVAKSAAARKRERAEIERRVKRMNSVFVASTSLKPMARQLLQTRSRAAYAGVEAFAVKHAGTEAGAMADLDIGYARILDREYAQAIVPLKKAKAHAGDLADYADYFLAQAYSGTVQPGLVVTRLKDFEKNYPDSLFLRDAIVLYANALTATDRPQEALAVLLRNRVPQRADYELAIGRAYLKAGDSLKAAEALSHLYYTIPLSPEASEARVDLDSLRAAGVIPLPSTTDRKQRADLLADGRRYADAAREYRALLNDVQPNERPAIQAALGMALHRSGDDREARAVLDAIPQSTEPYNAQRLLAMAEMARSSNDETAFTQALGQLRQNHSSNSYFGDALMLGGNMYLLRSDYDKAIDYYRELQQRFPSNKRGSYGHWKAAWLNLRQGRTEEARKLFDEQIDWYPTAPETPAALYWGGRLAEENQDTAKARQYYAKLAEAFKQYYYADLGRERLGTLGAGSQADTSSVGILQKVSVPTPSEELLAETPKDNMRVEKSKLLDNAGMVDFAVRELRLAASTDGGGGWANREIARMFTDNGRYDRALQTLKRAFPTYFALDTSALPRDCWEMLFPRAYWTDVTRYSAENGLDPYLVAALIRQESEFNPGAMSGANAYGLMQLLPGTGRTVARSLKVKKFSTQQLLSPTTNIQLGTRYFRDLVARYNGRFEYALAAYNAGADRVDNWLASGKYRDTQEFVESIPFTETREYVQAIMRNASIYRKLYANQQQLSSAERVSQAGNKP